MQPVQFRMARAALGLSPDDLAKEARIGAEVVRQIERGTPPDSDDEHALNLYFAARGIEWIDGDGVRAKGELGDAFVTVDQLTTDNDGGEG